MTKTITGKRVKFEVELYWRGKRKKPSCTIIYASNDYDGLPDHISAVEFQTGAEILCKRLIDAGELDNEPDPSIDRIIQKSIHS